MTAFLSVLHLVALCNAAEDLRVSKTTSLLLVLSKAKWWLLIHQNDQATIRLCLRSRRRPSFGLSGGTSRCATVSMDGESYDYCFLRCSGDGDCINGGTCANVQGYKVCMYLATPK
ncbi:hypothetical protein FOL46_000008 [Perkinsus olseni]|uniref:Uncharacterized protein n=1 Tax=Perkinsus olseni TaxID=32597 RepID=A0A7J6MY58_PEROL|nr:hypothetical protein FOL46_000008 [Perkinsus olseni]